MPGARNGSRNFNYAARAWLKLLLLLAAWFWFSHSGTALATPVGIQAPRRNRFAPGWEVGPRTRPPPSCPRRPPMASGKDRRHTRALVSESPRRAPAGLGQRRLTGRVVRDTAARALALGASKFVATRSDRLHGVRQTPTLPAILAPLARPGPPTGATTWGRSPTHPRYSGSVAPPVELCGAPRPLRSPRAPSIRRDTMGSALAHRANANSYRHARAARAARRARHYHPAPSPAPRAELGQCRHTRRVVRATASRPLASGARVPRRSRDSPGSVAPLVELCAEPRPTRRPRHPASLVEATGVAGTRRERP